MIETRFRVEINLIGITRKKATETFAGFFGATKHRSL